MVTGIIITHGNLAESLVATVEKIIGPVQSLIPLSNEGFSLKDLINHLNPLIHDHLHDDGICLMVELRGGSCWMAAKQVIRNLENIFIISGVNIPMLLTFITMRDSLQLTELINKMKESGVRGIIVDNFLEEKSTL